MKEVRFRIRSDRDGPIFFQFVEQGGEPFFMMVGVETVFKTVTIRLGDLQPDPAKRQDGRLDPSAILSLLVADNAGTNGVTGERTLWISDFELY